MHDNLTSDLIESSPPEIYQRLSDLIATTTTIKLNLIESILQALEQKDLIFNPELDPLLAIDSPWLEQTSGCWLIAKIQELRGNRQAAVTAWDRMISKLPQDRSRITSKAYSSAYQDLRAAIAERQEYDFLTKAAKLLSRWRKQSVPPTMRTIKIAIFSSTTTDLLTPLLELVCFREGIDAKLYIPAYGSYQQEILNPDSNFYQLQPDVTILAVNWRDLHLSIQESDPITTIQTIVAETRNRWATILDRCPCHILQYNFEIPPFEPWGYLNHSLPTSRGSILAEIDRQLWQDLPAGVSIVNIDGIAAEFGKQRWVDNKYWHLAKQYPAVDALPLLIEHQVALIRARSGLTKKVLILDLDNTLWGGVIGEDGINGIEIGSPSATGEVFQAFQTYILGLKQRGILLAVCSKNNDEDARLPFLQHEGMRLKLVDFAIFRANWASKASNIQEIATTLNLGLDSFVFIDDNPLERALVRQEIPEVVVPELGSDPCKYIEILHRGLYFESTDLSAEDLGRNQSYQANDRREQLKSSTTSLADFLTSLEMSAETGEFNDRVLKRVVQLIGKTNQFNLTTQRYTEEQVRQMMGAARYWTQYFTLTDRYGDNGLIGVIIAKQTEVATCWEIDTWLMSCRVMGRTVEQMMFAVLQAALAQQGANQIIGRYLPTRKNSMVANLYVQLGFEPLETNLEQGNTYLINLAAEQLPTADRADRHYIKINRSTETVK
jgi:FkbH-like protein